MSLGVLKWMKEHGQGKKTAKTPSGLIDESPLAEYIDSSFSLVSRGASRREHIMRLFSTDPRPPPPAFRKPKVEHVENMDVIEAPPPLPIACERAVVDDLLAVHESKDPATVSGVPLAGSPSVEPAYPVRMPSDVIPTQRPNNVSFTSTTNAFVNLSWDDDGRQNEKEKDHPAEHLLHFLNTARPETATHQMYSFPSEDGTGPLITPVPHRPRESSVVASPMRPPRNPTQRLSIRAVQEASEDTSAGGEANVPLITPIPPRLGSAAPRKWSVVASSVLPPSRPPRNPTRRLSIRAVQEALEDTSAGGVRASFGPSEFSPTPMASASLRTKRRTSTAESPWVQNGKGIFRTSCFAPSELSPTTPLVSASATRNVGQFVGEGPPAPDSSSKRRQSFSANPSNRPRRVSMSAAPPPQESSYRRRQSFVASGDAASPRSSGPSTRTLRNKATWNDVYHGQEAPAEHALDALSAAALATWVDCLVPTAAAPMRISLYHALVISVDAFCDMAIPAVPQVLCDSREMQKALRALGYHVDVLQNPTTVNVLAYLRAMAGGLAAKNCENDAVVVWVGSRGCVGPNDAIGQPELWRYMFCSDTVLDKPGSYLPLRCVTDMVTKAYVVADMWAAPGAPHCGDHGFGWITGRKTFGSELYVTYGFFSDDSRKHNHWPCCLHQGLLTNYVLKALGGRGCRESRLSVNSVNTYVALKLMQMHAKVVTTAHPLHIGGHVLALSETAVAIKRKRAQTHALKRTTPMQFNMDVFVPIQILRNTTTYTTMFHQFLRRLLQRKKHDRIALAIDCVWPRPGIVMSFPLHDPCLPHLEAVTHAMPPTCSVTSCDATNTIHMAASQEHQKALENCVAEAVAARTWACVFLQRAHITFRGCARDAMRVNTYLRLGHLQPYCYLETFAGGEPDPIHALLVAARCIQRAWYRYYAKNRTLILLRSQRVHETDRDVLQAEFYEWRHHEVSVFHIQSRGVEEGSEGMDREELEGDQDWRFSVIVKQYMTAYSGLVASGKMSLVLQTKKNVHERIFSESSDTEAHLVGGRGDVEIEERVVRINLLEAFRFGILLHAEHYQWLWATAVLSAWKAESVGRYNKAFDEYKERLSMLNALRESIVMRPIVFEKPLRPETTPLADDDVTE